MTTLISFQFFKDSCQTAVFTFMPLRHLHKIIYSNLATLSLVKTRYCIQIGSILALVVFWLSSAHAVSLDVRCPDGKLSDGVQRAGNSQHCLVIRKFEPLPGSAARLPVILVFLHGDSPAGAELLPDRGVAFNMADQLSLSTIALQRPGYQSSFGLSDGTAGNDDYTEGNIVIVAAALERLRTLNVGKKIVLVGHAGGAAMAALLASRFPASADAFLLVACPCDVPLWQQWRNTSTGRADHRTKSLSPQAEVAKITAGARIALLIGSKDDSMPSKFSETYAATLQRQGIKTRLTYAIGATHVSVLRSPEFFMLTHELVGNLFE